MPKIAKDLADLPVEQLDVLPAASIEALGTGHGMTEIAASCGCFGSCSVCCGKAAFDDEV